MTEKQATFGQWMRAARISRKMTQRELAQKAGLSQADISDLENGSMIEPTSGEANRIRAALAERMDPAEAESLAQSLEIAREAVTRAWLRGASKRGYMTIHKLGEAIQKLKEPR